MPGLFGILNLGAQSLSNQQLGIEVAGHNLANVNTPGYSRQRVNLATTTPIRLPFGPVGTGAQVTGISQVRNAILDSQIQGETSVRGFLDAQRSALQYGQAILGQSIDRLSSGAEGAAAAAGVGGQHGIAEHLADLFASFQSLSTDPASLTERQNVLLRAQELATQFNQIDGRLGGLRDSLNRTLGEGVDQANALIDSIADLNRRILTSENGQPGSANDLRDLRQQRIEELAGLVDLQTVEQANGAVNLSIAGVDILDGPNVLDRLETFDAGGGQFLVRTQAGAATLALGGGSLQGTIEARDGGLQTLRTNLDTLAGQLITQVNTLHRAGFDLAGGTGQDFFTGTGAADIAVNSVLLADPARLQAAGAAGAAGDNQVALALGQLANQPQAGLGNRTFSQSFTAAVAGLGQSIQSLNSQIASQDLVGNMLLRQRDAVSGVSLDEEMTNLMRYQKAFEASARVITTVDEMLETVLSLKR
ncbi:MAG: flagellar hook-associated protein FlgK [Verrucomicrobiota bacterium]|jgi:flagellar hook-associated protein 1 FlgK